MNKKTTYAVIGVALVLVIIFFSFGSGSDESTSILANVTKGKFVSDINVTGELEARSSVKITAPTKVRQYRVYEMTIQDLIPEGTKVKKGQYIGRLDPSDLSSKLKDSQVALEGAKAKYVTQKLDTALEMKKARNELINLGYDVVEKQLNLDQSKFEPPAVIKKNEIALDKAKRAHIQKKESYEITKQQNETKMFQAKAETDNANRDIDGIKELLGEFTIKAPEDGMLIYDKNPWSGQKTKVGSRVYTGRTVATLPDLSTMNSKTFVNEVDIRRIKKGQIVEIGLDALPDKRLTGVISAIANTGQKRPNSDSKVFEIMIEVDAVDDLIKPGMTTSNKIFTSVVEEALSIPLECLHNFQDSITYVFARDGVSYIKKEIQVGETNDTSAEVLLGLDENDKLYLASPEGSDDDEIALLEELNGKRNRKEEVVEKDKPSKSFPRMPKKNS